MTFSLPNSISSLYNEICDELINDDMIGRQCKLFYPALNETCDNCTFNPMTHQNAYRHGGPAPFHMGKCPICGGSGTRETESTETVRLRVYWYTSSRMAIRSMFKRVAGNVDIPTGLAMTIGFKSDINKIKQAREILLIDEVGHDYRYKLFSEPIPHGFNKNRYFVAFWERI